MSLITSVLGSTVGKFFGDKCYWACKLTTGKWCSELDIRMGANGLARPFDWTCDLVDTGDIEKIQELWLFCPPNKLSPLGNTARLPLSQRGKADPGTFFQFKVANIDALAPDLTTTGRTVESQVIGQVYDKETGACDCFIWDTNLHALGTYHTSIYNFGSWREGIAPVSHLSFEVLGLKLD